MKIFRGTGATKVVTVEKGKGKPKELKGGPFAWGKNDPKAPTLKESDALATAILKEVLGVGMRADKLKMRFCWRIVRDTFNANHDFVINENEIQEIIKDIEKTEKDTVGMRRKVANELPKGVQIDGQLSADQGWTSEPTIKSNR